MFNRNYISVFRHDNLKILDLDNKNLKKVEEVEKWS